MHSHLPAPTGHYGVGFVDIESMRNLEFTCPFGSSGGAFARVFYPAAISTPNPSSKWFLGRPYLKGVTVMLNLKAKPLVTTAMQAMWHSQHIVAEENASPLTSHKWPVVVFSHGLSGHRMAYSVICTDLASHGYVVIAMEHRDGSASAASSTIAPGYNDKCANIDENGYLLYYGVARGLAQGYSENEFRQLQIQHRVAEVMEMLDVMEILNGGDFSTLKLSIPRATNDALEAQRTVIEQFRGTMALDDVSIVGHSFGGATVATLGHDKPTRFKCTVALDIWTIPVPKRVYSEVFIPTLFINTSTFHWEENKRNIDHFVATAKTCKVPCIVSELVGTTHQDQSDFSMLSPKTMKLLGFAGKTPVAESLFNCNRLTEAWLARFMCGFSPCSFHDKTNKMILEEGVPDRVIIHDKPLAKVAAASVQ